MALMKLKGGPRDGETIMCACPNVCVCESFGHGHKNEVFDGYVEWLMYKREGDCWVPSHVVRETCVPTGGCPRCGRVMPIGTVYCKNCGAEMDVSHEWESDNEQ